MFGLLFFASLPFGSTGGQLSYDIIAAIHGLEESGGRKFLVMELVGGETLAERIKRPRIRECGRFVAL
jgi:hypothetical protein